MRRRFLPRIDRTRAAELGRNASQIATNLNVSLSSSEQVTPNFCRSGEGDTLLPWRFRPRSLRWRRSMR